MDRKIRDLLYGFFNDGYFNYFGDHKSKVLPVFCKRKLYENYLRLTSFSEKLNLLSDIGDDNIIEDIQDSIIGVVRHGSPEKFSFLGYCIGRGMQQVLDDILQDYFNEALSDWNDLYREDNLRNRPNERDLNIISDNRTRL